MAGGKGEASGRTLRGKGEMPNDPEFWSNLRQVIQEEVASAVEDKIGNRLQQMQQDLDERMERLENSLSLTTGLQKTVSDLESSMQFHSDRLESLATVSLPALAEHVEKVTTALALQTLDIDMHRRKWSLIVHGLKGNPKEEESTTREKVVNLATTHLGISDASVDNFSACHRLKSEGNAGIIIRFKDLGKRNLWLACAKKLKGLEEAITLSPDLPPPLRRCKTELLNHRKGLPDDQKRRSFIRQLPRWPYVELVVPNARPKQHSFTTSDILQKALKLDIPLGFTIREDTNTAQ